MRLSPVSPHSRYSGAICPAIKLARRIAATAILRVGVSETSKRGGIDIKESLITFPDELYTRTLARSMRELDDEWARRERSGIYSYVRVINTVYRDLRTESKNSERASRV